MAKDYYQVLGVSKDATEADVKKAFRKLAHEHHPDKHSGNEAKFKEINEAYQVLGNKEKREQYDRFGMTHDEARRQGGAPGGGYGGFSAEDFARASGGFRTDNVNFDFGDLGDIFGDMFGMGGGRARRAQQGRRKGADIEAVISIPFRDAVFGTEKTFTLNKEIHCSRCSGNGVEPGSKLVTCNTCGGSGQVESVQQTFFGAFRQAGVCPECHGAGQKPEKKCTQCGGVGHVTGQETIKVKIPAGINEGETIRVTGKGGAGMAGAEAGDLFINMRVEKSDLFKRDGDDIYSELHTSVAQAALGTKTAVQTLDGEVMLKIPGGTQSGKVFRLKEKGVPHLRKRGRGDHFVTVVVDIPTRLSSKAKKLYKQLADTEGEVVDTE
ncbi:MAG: molecular chaperone DnaJ [Patescibacteria group bacterium]|jgi:molecular chaperone DnaJ